MGVLLDSSVAIKAERLGLTARGLLTEVITLVGDQPTALSAIGYTELVHGLYRADSDARRAVRLQFFQGLTRELYVYPYTRNVAEIAGKIDAEARMRQITIPFSDLLIGSTAISLGFSILTVNVRHFQL